MNFLRDKYFWLPVSIALFSNIIASSVISTLVFLVVNEFQMEKRYVSIFIISGMFAAMIFSPYIGRYSDLGKIEQKRALMFTAIANIIGAAIFVFYQSYWVFVIVNATLFAIGGSNGFLITSYAKIKSEDYGEYGQDSVMATRATVSLGWAVGPAMGGYVVYEYGFTSLFWTLLIMNILVFFLCWILPSLDITQKEDADEVKDEKTGKVKLNLKAKLLIICFLFTHIVISCIAIVLPLHVLDLGGNEKDAGFAFGIAAFIEIPILLVCARFLKLTGPVKMMYIIFISASLSAFLSGYVTELNHFYWLQILSGSFMALTMGIGMTLIQETMPNNPATIIAYYSNMYRLSILIGTGGAGFVAEYLVAADFYMLLAILPLISMLILFLYRNNFATLGQVKSHVN